jgi:TPP-dependent pyruvate/acetoin dehydrogenase alpha subunit
LCDQFPDIAPQLESAEKRVDKIVADAVAFADKSPVPTGEDLTSNVYV